MHPSSVMLMSRLLARYGSQDTAVVDVGSFGATDYKRLCTAHSMRYLGIDIRAGFNVDIVVPEFRSWDTFVVKSDLVISGQALEHVQAPWIWIRQVRGILKPNGIAIIIAPWKWRVHRHPRDCWRILPDGIDFLLRWGGFTVLEVGIPENTIDCYGVGRR